MADQVRKLRVELEAAIGHFEKGMAQAAKSVSGVESGMKRLGDSTEGLGDKFSKAFKSLTGGGGVSGALSALGPAGLAASAGLAAVGFAAVKLGGEMKDLAGKAEEWTNLAKTTGLGTTQIQQLSALLEDAGIPAEALATSMKVLHREIADGGKNLEKYGIDLGSIKDLSPEEQLQAVAQAIGNISDENVRGAAAQAAFGRSGEQLIPVLDSIADSSYKAAAALDEGQIRALTHLDDELDKAARSWTNFKNEGLGAIAKIINALDDFDDRTTGKIRNPVTESIADFERRMARIAADTSKLDLGPATAEQKAAVRAYEEGQRKVQAETKKSADEAERARVKFTALLDELSGKTAQAEVDEITRAFGELGVSGVADLEALRKKLEQLEQQGAKITDKGLLGVLRGGKVEIPKELGDLNLGVDIAEIPNLLAIAQEQFNGIALAGARAHESTEGIKIALESAGTAGGQLEVALAAIPVTFGSVFKDAMAQLPNVILGAIQGGGNVGKAAGSFFGGSLLTGLTGEKGPLSLSKLTSVFGSTFGGALNAILPGLGSILGAGLGSIFDKIGGLFGNKTIMKVNDLRDAFLASQGGWLQLQQTLAKGTDEDLVKQIFDAKTVDEFNAAVEAVKAVLATLGEGIQPVTIPVSFDVQGAPAGVPSVTPEEIPGFARGAFVDMPTLAMVGEAGPEWVIPDDVMQGGGIGGTSIEITNQVGLNPLQTAETARQAAEFVARAIERRLFRSFADAVAAGRA